MDPRLGRRGGIFQNGSVVCQCGFGARGWHSLAVRCDVSLKLPSELSECQNLGADRCYLAPVVPALGSIIIVLRKLV